MGQVRHRVGERPLLAGALKHEPRSAQRLGGFRRGDGAERRPAVRSPERDQAGDQRRVRRGERARGQACRRVRDEDHGATAAQLPDPRDHGSDLRGDRVEVAAGVGQVGGVVRGLGSDRAQARQGGFGCGPQVEVRSGSGAPGGRLLGGGQQRVPRVCVGERRSDEQGGAFAGRLPGVELGKDLPDGVRVGRQEVVRRVDERGREAPGRVVRQLRVERDDPVARLDLAGDGGERTGEASRRQGLERAAQRRREAPQPRRGVEQRVAARPPQQRRRLPTTPAAPPARARSAARCGPRRSAPAATGRRTSRPRRRRGRARRSPARRAPGAFPAATRAASRARASRTECRPRTARWRSGRATCAAGRAGRRAAGRGPCPAAGPAVASRPAARAAWRGGRAVPPA